MRLQIALLVSAVLSPGAANAAVVEIKDAVARVVVIPEDRSDVNVEVVRANPRLPLTVRVAGERTIVDGRLDMVHRLHNCRASRETSRVEIRGVGAIAWDEMPQVTIRTPRAVHVDAGGAVFGAVGRSASLALGAAGCGDWTIANVAGQAKVSQAGSGDMRLGSAGALKISLAGSGDVAATDVRGALDINIAGSGSATVRSVQGPLEVSIAGSGDVLVQGGHATSMKVSVAGSGDVDFRGSADALRARIAGSGDVRAREVRGEVSKMILGAGSVRVGD